MSQMLFYENAVPVSPQQHGDLSVDNADYKFAANVNSVPMMAAELPAAVSDYTIVFAGNEESVTPVVVLGLEDGKNEYVADGKWSAGYIPAFVRRYPFVFAQNENTLTLCIDESWSGWNKEGKGQRLFTESGERTEYLNTMLKFLEESQTQFARTQVFCKRLKEMDLLEPMKADFTLPSGERRSLGGFMAVSRDKLKALPPEKLAELAKSNELELIYTHLLSMNNFRRVLEKSAQSSAKTEASAPVEEPAAETSDA